MGSTEQFSKAVYLISRVRRQGASSLCKYHNARCGSSGNRIDLGALRTGFQFNILDPLDFKQITISQDPSSNIFKMGIIIIVIPIPLDCWEHYMQFYEVSDGVQECGRQ